MALPTLTMQAPASFGGNVVGTPSGTVYVPNALAQVAALYADVPTLLSLGFYPNVAGSDPIGYILGANMNVTTDQAFTMALPANVPFVLQRILVVNPSISLTTAAGGIYTAASKGGTAVVANTQVYSALTAYGKALNLTMAAILEFAAGASPILSLTTAQGAAATADVYLFGDAVLR